ncbi:MAG: flavodoxin family protein [Pseudomonadota bacterium]
MTIIGISSSPILNGNVDRMVQYVLGKSGKPSEFINLTELTFSPCRACAHLCAKDNLCKLDDDLKPLYGKLMASEGIVLGTPAYFNNMNGFMTLFLERLWAFRHQRFPLEGKPFAAIASGGICAPHGAIESIKERMAAYRANYVGCIAFLSTILPCFKCGYGTRCKVGSLYDIYGEEGQKTIKINHTLFKRWEDTLGLPKKLEALAIQLAAT